MMKKYIAPVIIILMICQSFTVSSKDLGQTLCIISDQADTNDKMSVIVGNDFFRIDENDSSLSVRIGKRGLNILETLEGKKVDIEKIEKQTEVPSEEVHYFNKDEEHDYFMKARHFRGHWAGLEAGFNNYNHVASMALPDQIDYMSLDANNSMSLNLNLSQLNIGFGRRVGIVTGLGLNWNNYRFHNLNSIKVNDEGVIEEFTPTSTIPVKRSKFSTLYMNVPVLFEIQIPAGYSNSLNVAAGFIGGIKLNAWTKLVFENGEKSRKNGDYNLNLLRGGATARIGYKNFMIYGTYYLTSWFQESKGPNGYNLEPFEIGLAFTFND